MSFDSDFAFMRSLGYDQGEIYKKGRFRPATFWKGTRVMQYGSTIHKDRCLMVALTKIDSNEIPSDAEKPPSDIAWVSNLHLSAGNGLGQNERRLRQMYECVDTIRKEQNKVLTIVSKDKKGPKKKGQAKDGSGDGDNFVDLSFTTVIVGDMNMDSSVERALRGEGNSAVDELLTKGVVDAGFIEDGVTVTSKAKINKIGLLCDAYELAYKPDRPPATLVVEGRI